MIYTRELNLGIDQNGSASNINLLIHLELST